MKKKFAVYWFGEADSGICHETDDLNEAIEELAFLQRKIFSSGEEKMIQILMKSSLELTMTPIP